MAGARDKDQVNLTDPASRIMNTRKDFDQCYNAQATVDTETMQVVGQTLTQASNNHRQIEPTSALALNTCLACPVFSLSRRIMK